MAMDDTESCSSRAVDSSPAQPRQHRQKLEVFNEVLRRIQESDYEEAKLHDFGDQLWLHFNRLPARYALDVNVERAEDVLTHQRLLHLAEDPANGIVFEVRLVQVHSASYEDSVDSAYSTSPMKEDPQSYSNYSSRQGIHPPPTFGSSPNLEALALQANRFRVEDGDSTVNFTSSLARTMHEITFSSVDKPKLLSQLTSILAEVGLNIQEAHAFSTVDGFSLYVFVVDGWPYEETEQLRIAMEKEILKIKRMSNNIVQPLQQPSGEESEKQSKAYWDDSTIDAFIKVCAIETLAGNRPNSHFNKLGWKNVIKAFNNLTGRNYQFIQLKNKWSSLKKDWQLWNTLIEKETDLGWDPMKQTINASNEWWNKKLKENPEAIKFKTKGLKNVEQLNILFKDIVVTGEGAWASSQGFVGQDVDDSSKVGERKDNIIEDQDDSSCNPSLDTISHSFEATSQPSMEKKNEGRRKRKRDETKSEVVTMQLERICSAVENRSSITSRADKSGCSIVEVMKIIRGIPEVKNDFELYMKAIDIMIIKENREMFIALEDPIDQIAWLKHKHV